MFLSSYISDYSQTHSNSPNMNSFGILVLVAFIGTATCGVLPSNGNKTLCQDHRERELKSSVVAKVVPECDENGDYKPKACYGESVGGKQFCVCFSKDGQVVKSPSQKTKACECHREVYESTTPQRIGAFTPSCQPDGTYAPKQCHGSTGMCWCAHPNGEKKTEPSRGELKCE